MSRLAAVMAPEASSVETQAFCTTVKFCKVVLPLKKLGPVVALMLLPTIEPEAVSEAVEIEELMVKILPTINPEVCKEPPVMDPEDDTVLHTRVSSVVVPLNQLSPVVMFNEGKTRLLPRDVEPVMTRFCTVVVPFNQLSPVVTFSRFRTVAPDALSCPLITTGANTVTEPLKKIVPAIATVPASMSMSPPNV